MPAAARSGLGYTWLRDGSAIAGATTDSYTVAAADIGHDISVRITASCDYSGELTSSAVTALKAVTAAPSAPTLASASTNSITLNTISGQEYRLGNGPWQTSGVFSGLLPDTSYNFYTRIAETETAMASSPSAAAVFKTEPQHYRPYQPPFFFRIVYRFIRIGFFHFYIPHVILVRNRFFWGF